MYAGQVVIFFLRKMKLLLQLPKLKLSFCMERRNAREYWDCTLQALTFENDLGPNLIVDDGGDATLLISQRI